MSLENHVVQLVTPVDSSREFLAGGGEMGARMRGFDWTTTPLGPPDRWPQSLKTIVRVMLDSRYAMWMLWGPELTFFCNDAYLPTVGIKRDWVLGARSDKVWEEIWPDIEPRIRQVLTEGKATWDEALMLFLERSGFTEETYHTFSYSPVYDDTSRIAGMLCVVTEITERVVGERRLRVLRDLAARSAGMESVQQAGERLVAVLSHTPADVPFACLYELGPARERARLAAWQGSLPQSLRPAIVSLAHDSPWPLRAVASSGRAAVVALEGLPERIPAPLWPEQSLTQALVLPVAGQGSAEPVAVLVVGVSPRRPLDGDYRTFLDLVAGQFAAAIGDARSYEAERQRAEALAEIDHAKTTFFSNVSHEFRTPLTLMLGPVEDAAADPDTPGRVRIQLARVHRNGLRLLKLVNSLLDFSRIEAGRMQAAYEPTDLAAFTRDLSSTFRSAIERTGLAYEVRCEAPGAPVYVDREMWEKIVLNLLSNALKYTLRGGIGVRLKPVNEAVLLEVSDTGVGIPAHELPRLFERFHRVAGTVGRTQEGSGIGLALVQELVKLHGGTVEVESEAGQGTTFRVRLPVGEAHLPPQQIRAARAPSSTHPGAQVYVQEALGWLPDEADAAPHVPPAGDGAVATLGRHYANTAGSRILLADDNADMRAYVSELLAPFYKVEAVGDGAQALAAARRRRPDLVLSDIMMPMLDGLGLLEALRADESLREVPVVLLSARAGEAARVEGLEAGADDYLVKPFSARELLARVGALLELTKMRRESEERFRAFVGATSDALFRMSPDWSEVRQLAGEGPGGAGNEPARNWLDALHPEDRPRAAAAIEDAVQRRGVFQLEHRVRRADGTFGWAFSRAVPLMNSRAEILEWFGAASDITERKNAEQALRQSQTWLSGQKEAFQSAVNGAPLEVSLNILIRIAVAHMDGKARCAFYLADTRCGELRHLIGMSEPYARAVDGLKIGPDSLGCGLAIHSAEPVVTPDVTREPRWKDWLWLAEIGGYRACWSFPVESSGKVVGTLALYFQEPREPTARERELAAILTHSAAIIISRHQEAEALAASRHALLESDRQKDEFLAMLAHELRNPLAPISMAGEVLARTLPQDSAAVAAVGMIKRQAVQLTRLVDDLLDIGRITQGRIHLTREPVEVSSIISQAVETVEPQFRQKRHDVSIVSSYEPLYVNGDFARLMQCVVNILTNAARYTDPEGQIRVQTREQGASVVIEISDTGMGIPPALLPKIFDLFVQSERTLDRAQGGLGIGLALVKRLIGMHGGEVTAHSAGVGQGATFEIRLPRIARPRARAQVDSLRSPPRRVLIVDDNADAANSLALLLSSSGHETQVVHSGRDALERMESFRPEVALLDIGLPEMNGYELAQRLRASDKLKAVRLVALTGYGYAEDRQRALAAGFHDHLVKPVDMPTLERALAAVSEMRAH